MTSTTTPTIPTTAIHVRDVAKSFGSGASATRALRGASASFPTGAITMLVGPSGCGKTTLLSIIAGLLQPSDGSVSVLDQDPFALPPSQRAAFRRTAMGFIFQQYNLIPSLTAAENAAVPLLAAGVPRAAALARAAHILASLGLPDRIHSLPRTLSGGQQQRVAVARALVHNPRVILCDEPTAALDAASGHAVMRLLVDVALRPDCAVVVVTHDSRIFDFAHQIVTMEDGVITSIHHPRHHTSAPTPHPATTPEHHP
jgi:putative ABC transport system ATP-binding protein